MFRAGGYLRGCLRAYLKITPGGFRIETLKPLGVLVGVHPFEVYSIEVRPGEERLGERRPGEIRSLEVRPWFDRVAVDFHDNGDRRIRDTDLEATAISVREGYPPFHATVGLKRDWPSDSRNVGPNYMKILRVTDGTVIREWLFLEEFVWAD